MERRVQSGHLYIRTDDFGHVTCPVRQHFQHKHKEMKWDSSHTASPLTFLHVAS